MKMLNKWNISTVKIKILNKMLFILMSSEVAISLDIKSLSIFKIYNKRNSWIAMKDLKKKKKSP